jgi:Tfp pilus assembly protein PilF
MRTSLVLAILLPLAAALLGACASQPTATQTPVAVPASGAAPVRLTDEQAHARFQQGLLSYKENNLDMALDELDSASSGGQLKNADMIIAHKTMAFIHCTKGRETQCREQFQEVLKIDPKYDLASSETGNPAWGAVWHSMRDTADDKMAVAQGSVAKASLGQQKMAEGIKEYDAGNYAQAMAMLQAALDKGLQNKTDEIRTHKYLAFATCLKGTVKQCRAEFHAIFTLDNKFQLSPSEIGHPAWKKIYKDELAMAGHAVAQPVKNAGK